jgi:hypothetical protein
MAMFMAGAFGAVVAAIIEKAVSGASDKVTERLLDAISGARDEQLDTEPAEGREHRLVGYGVGYGPKERGPRDGPEGLIRAQDGGPPGGIRTPDLLIRSQPL